MENKKGLSMNIGGLVAIVVTIFIFVFAFVPIYTNSVDASKTYSCDDEDADTLNWSVDPPQCYDAENTSVTSDSTRTGTTSAQEILLGLGVTFGVIGALIFVGKKTNVI